MPHLPENNPLVHISREINNISFMLGRVRAGDHTYLEAVPARLDILALARQRLVDEQETLKSAFKQKAREANLFKLKCIHWRQQYERSEQERYRLQRLLDQVRADHSATRAALAQAEFALARKKYSDG